MISLPTLRNKHRARPAAILGGGPSLLTDMQRLPEFCIKLAVNEHPYFVGITAPDYLVFMDDPAHNTRLMQAVANSYGFRVSPDLQYTNVDLRGMPEFYYRGSGIVAAWFACHLGCDPVILCGMDLYQGAQKYIHGDDDYQNLDVYRIPLEEHLKRWEPLRGFKQIRVIDSPLKKYFPVL